MQIEEEILNELRGSYKTSFYSIYLNGSYEEDISKMSQKDQGTLLHEYIHYLQNISTPFCMYMSMTRYSLMSQSLHNIITNDTIHIPVNPVLSKQSVASYKKLMTVLGTKKLDRGQNIDWSKEIRIVLDTKDVEGSNIERAIFKVALTDGKQVDIEIGAIIVMETMSALYQSLIDPNASHPDIPYNIIMKYCQKYYPRLASDTRKLICLCYASLYTSCPGSQLIRLIKDYGNNDSIDGYAAFCQFVNAYNAGIKVDGSLRTLTEYVDEMIDKFKAMMANILTSKIEFLDVIFEPIRLSQKWVPVVSALYDKTPFSLNHFKTIIENVGLPYIHTSYQQYSFPNLKGKSDASLDLIELIALQTVYSYFATTKSDDKECELSYMCKGNKYNEDHCKNHPWTQEIECPFSMVCNACGIDKKTIIG